MEKDGGGDFVGEAGGKNVGVREIENEAGQKRSGSGKETATDEKKKRESEGAKDDDAQTNANEIAAKEVHGGADEIEGEGGMDAVKRSIRRGYKGGKKHIRRIGRWELRRPDSQE